jgi:sugar lactone lactonase YvrE
MTRGRVVVVYTSAVLLCVAGTASLAQASIGHEFRSALTEASPGTALGEPSTVAVDHATGQVFVGDAGAGQVDVYSSEGVYESRFGEGLEATSLAVDEATGDLYVASAGESAVIVYRPVEHGGYQLLAEWSGAGVPAKAFGEVTGVAVDNSTSLSDPTAGDVYVVEAETAGGEGGAVDVFRPKPNPEGAMEGEGEEGKFVKRLSGPALEEPNGIAVNATTGRVYVADSVKGAIYVYSDAGTFEEKLTGKGQPFGSFRGKEEEEGNVAGVAVEESSGDIYVAEAERQEVSQYGASGEWLGWIRATPSGALGEPRGVAVASSGEVYVGDAAAGRVDVFGPGVVVPDVSSGKASKVTRTSAMLSGTINGDGEPAKYRFEWGTTEAYGQSTPTTAAGAGEEKVSVALATLHPSTTYYFRIVGENANGENEGIGRQFTTTPAVELSTGAVKELQPESATLTGTLTPGGFDTHYYFEWGTTNNYGAKSPELPADAGSSATAVSVEAKLGGLTANTVYHYRLVGENEFGGTFGSDQMFTTSGPPRITSRPPTGIAHETATINAQVNPDQLQTTYHFEYGQTTAYGAEIPLGGASVGSGGVPVPVSASLTGLKLGATYHYRVVASNSANTSDGLDQTFTTVPPALITSSAAAVTATEATLNAQINPLGNDTTVYFQYGTESCAEHPGACTDRPAPPGEDIGSGEENIAKTLHLTGLEPDTTYRYRVIAINSLGTSEGPEGTLTTPKLVSAFALPDSRAWEMVSPPDKQGAPVEALTREGGIILASEDGNKLTYVVDGALGENVQGNRSPEWQQILATRATSSWSSQDIATPSSKPKGVTAGQAPEYQYFTPDLSTALDEPAGHGGSAEPPLAPGVTQATPYLRDNVAGTYLPLVTEADVMTGTMFGGQLHFVAATPDLNHVAIRSNVALTGSGSAHGLYEWTAGQLRFVSVLPNGTPATEPELGFDERVLTGAIATDGSRIIWTNREDLSTRGGHLYLRDTLRGQTLQLDAAQGAGEPPTGTAIFQGATSDGSHVFFTDKQQLTADSTAEPGPAAGKPDLYECEIVEEEGKLACHLKDLTVDHAEGEHAAVQGFLFGASDAGASVYLVAQGVLAGNENGNGEAAVAGGDNLYRLHDDGSNWSTTFIATLSSADSPEWEGNRVGDTAFLTARVSPSGRYLAFMSAASPTGYDNVDVNPEAKGARDEEVYLYDSATASLACVSCNPTGERPSGVLDRNESGEGLGLLVDRRKVWAEVGHEHWLAGNIPGWTAQSLTSALFQSRYLSDEGRLYFNSPDQLVPAAGNHKENVYEYEPSGLGSCESHSGGCVALLSSGSSDKESAFIEATPSGNDAFFVTESKLLPQDTDTAFDIYDARVCTPGSPCLTPPPSAPAGCSEAGTCRPASPSQEAPGGPSGTATFSGPGNAAPPPPAKQQVKGAKTGTKPLTRAQKLTNALKACKRQHSKKKRKACEAHARKLYGSKTKAKKIAKAKKRSTGRSSESGRR